MMPGNTIIIIIYYDILAIFGFVAYQCITKFMRAAAGAMDG
jgi:hypothetical protein